MKKCDKCKFSDISEIIFHDMNVQKCINCNIIRLNVLKYNELINKCIYEKNIANIRTHIDTSTLDKNDVKKIDTFKSYLALSSFNGIYNDNPSQICNVCESELYEFKNIFLSDFKIKVCFFCNSIYLEKQSFNDFLDLITERLNRKSVFQRLKEIFHRKMKDNVKK